MEHISCDPGWDLGSSLWTRIHASYKASNGNISILHLRRSSNRLSQLRRSLPLFSGTVRVFWSTTSRGATPPQESTTPQNLTKWRKPSRKSAEESCVQGSFSCRVMHNLIQHRLHAVTEEANQGFEQLPHAPYSPDLAGSVWLFLFPKPKSELCGCHFRSDGDVTHAVEAYLQAHDSSFFQEGIGMLEHWWTKCIETRGDYVEKYHMNHLSHAVPSQ